jgi:flagellar hook assembly protein FlgD
VPAARAEAVAKELSGQVGVASVEVAARRYALGAPDPYFADLQASYLNAVTAPAAWTMQPGSSSVKIAIIDTGVDVNHPDLVGKIAGAYNAVTGGTTVTDLIGHGTFVAGVAAAVTNNGVGISGAGDASSLLAVKVADASGDIYTDAEAAGITWAVDNGAKVINISLGSTTSDSTEQAAIAYAQSHGVTVVASAGNDGGVGGANAVNYPAGYPSVISAGATDAAGHKASFSEHGTWVTVAAPGVNIYSTTPTAGSQFFPASYAAGDGTSFSSPLVAGEVALLAAQAPGADIATLRQAVVASAHGYSGLGLGAGQVDFRAALDHLAPSTAPAITAPLDGDIVSGVMVLSATSSAPAVRFRVDGGWLGAPVAVISGTATSSWTSWGAGNVNHGIEAFDCTITAECATTSANVEVTLDNAPPQVTHPSTGLLLSGAYTATATSLGGGVAFLIDGVRRGFDGTAPYSFATTASGLTDGRHEIAVVECSSDGLTCAGPTSPAVTFTAKSLHPIFKSLSPSVFSPNGDHRVDSTKATFSLPDAESVLVRVRKSGGTVVRTVNLGRLGTGTHSWTWTGTGTGGRQHDGSYIVTLTTSRAVNGVVLHGDVSRTVRIDTVAPAMTSIAGAGVTFYPYRDNYRDTFAPAMTLSEGGTVSLTVRTVKGALVRKVSASRKAGRATIVWNGRNKSNKIVSAGKYRWQFRARDAAGNIRVSKSYIVYVSAKRLVTKSAVITVHGATTYNAGGSDSFCAEASFSLSDFAPYGVWLDNVCDPISGDLAAAFFHITLPAAHAYKSIRIDTYGNTISPPSRVAGAFLNMATGAYDLTSGVSVQGYRTNAWHNLGTRSGTSHVSGGRIVDAVVFVTTEDGAPSDFDVDYVRLRVSYTVLR